MEIVTDLTDEIESGYPDGVHYYLIADPENCQITSDRYELMKYVKKLFISLFGFEPEQTFWCYGYDVAYAGPIPEVTRL